MTECYKQAFLNREQQAFLLMFARNSLVAALSQQELPVPSVSAKFSKWLHKPSAVFVSIYKKGKLRGCIGAFRWNKPLWQAVQEMTLAAASKDSRFEPVQVDELPFLSFELSLLSKPEKVAGLEEIQVGRDGLLVIDEHAGKRGVLLPQVAVKYGWTKEEFLSHTCRKASLPAGAWQEESVSLFRFQAQVFRD